MIQYFDEDGNEIKDMYDPKKGIYIDAQSWWASYWTPLKSKRIEYDRTFKVFDRSIELKKYVDPRIITPYKIEEGYVRKTSPDGKTTSIVDRASGKAVISRVLSDDDFEKVLVRRQRQKKQSFINRALANPWTHWCTLTFSPEIAPVASYTYAEAKLAFMSWRKTVVRKFGGDFKYLAVAEYGEEHGRIHWHALLHFNNSVKFEQVKSPKGRLLYLTNSHQRNVLDESNKSVPKLVLPNWRFGMTNFYPTYNSPEKAVMYMAKYMSKGSEGAPYQQQGPGTKSYLASKGLRSAKREYLLGDEKSRLLEEEVQTRLERAKPNFELLNSGEEIMHKSVAILDEGGAAHIIETKTGIIDIAKKGHQRTTNHTDDPQ